LTSWSSYTIFPFQFITQRKITAKSDFSETEYQSGCIVAHSTFIFALMSVFVLLTQLLLTSSIVIRDSDI